MKKTVKLTARARRMSLMAGSALAADKVTLQLKWVTQAQFAGYFVAKDKGFYEEAGLDVDDQAGRPGHRARAGDRRRRRRRDRRLDGRRACRPRKGRRRSSTSPSRSRRPACSSSARKDGPVKTEADFKGKTLGVWFFGNEYPFYAWMNKLGLPTEGGADGVTVLKQRSTCSR